MPPAHLALLTNPDVLAIARVSTRSRSYAREWTPLARVAAASSSQDPAGRAGRRLGGPGAANAPQQVWSRALSNGDVAVALYNAGPPPAHPWHTACAPNASNATVGGYFRPAGTQPQSWCYAPGAESASGLDWYCCNDESCAGWWFDDATQAGCLLKDTGGGWEAGASLSGSVKLGFVPPSGAAAPISVDFAAVGMWPGGSGDAAVVRVYDVFARRDLGVTTAPSWNASAVPWQGTTLLRLSSEPSVTRS